MGAYDSTIAPGRVWILLDVLSRHVSPTNSSSEVNGRSITAIMSGMKEGLKDYGFSPVLLFELPAEHGVGIHQRGVIGDRHLCLCFVRIDVADANESTV